MKTLGVTYLFDLVGLGHLDRHDSDSVGGETGRQLAVMQTYQTPFINPQFLAHFVVRLF